MSFKEVYSSQRLIAEIKKRPGLYDPSSIIYADRVLKSKLWDEVCDVVVENWKKMDKGERAIKARDVQKRWKSLRDCFKRELILQEKMKRNGTSLIKKRKYVYFDSLSFLIPKARCWQIGGLTESASGDKTDEFETVKMNELNSSATFDDKDEKMELFTRSNNSQKENSHLDDDLAYISTAKCNGKEVIDDDKAFLVSLLPTLRQFDEEQKFKARMLIMDIVRQVQLGYNPRLVTYNSSEHVNSLCCNLNSLIKSDSVDNFDLKTNGAIKEEIIEEDEKFVEA